ncbi:MULTISPECIES: GspE/PulE family protein [Halanaerobium]|uniref:Type IV pilus assembly protein PilB n=1 Tax=Halanaerobium kushneri TaxID=56779 RepID=A0A1N6Q5U5_9FIRM|nr:MULTISPECIES: GspE/PulE family protein [Halanaerobium]RCW61178.1 type IV pilus assembly protein PilB [Halanaerobium sp. ST460_2HS_T2]SIQ11917.1 type IV pilus assembly protein PilB [Halanaerobium kushneri]
MQNFCEYLYKKYSFDQKIRNEIESKITEKGTKSLINYIKEENILSEKQLLQAVSVYFEIELFENSQVKVDKKIALKLDLSQSEKYRLLLLQKNEKIIIFGSIYPPDLFLKEKLKYQFKSSIKFYLMTEVEFNRVKNSIYNSYFQLDQQELLSDFGNFKKIDSRDIDSLKDLVDDAPVVKLLNKILTEAISLNASDIHLEKKKNYFKIRYRIDGILKSYYNLPVEIAAAVISRIKIISGMDITIRHLPQDGKLEFKFQNSNYDIRCSVIPTIYGEKAVLRLLLRSEKLLSVKELNLNSYNLKRFKNIFKYNSGIILLSGPTGSGKTTTLFSILNRLAAEKNNIITVENPVEYRLELLNQIEINNAQGLSFPVILRSILRQDPDIIMIGEIRDKETAEIAVRAAITGHLVLSTIHTIDSVSAVTRLIDMGIAPYLISSTLKAVVAQRLLRKLCPDCREKRKITREEINFIGEQKCKYVFQAVGCQNCSEGYLGRTAAAEVLLINKELRKLISQQADYELLKKAALTSGMLSLADSAFKKLKKGVTSSEEILRVIELNS